MNRPNMELPRLSAEELANPCTRISLDGVEVQLWQVAHLYGVHHDMPSPALRHGASSEDFRALYANYWGRTPQPTSQGVDYGGMGTSGYMTTAPLMLASSAQPPIIPTRAEQRDPTLRSSSAGSSSGTQDLLQMIDDAGRNWHQGMNAGDNDEDDEDDDDDSEGASTIRPTTDLRPRLDIEGIVWSDPNFSPPIHLPPSGPLPELPLRITRNRLKVYQPRRRSRMIMPLGLGLTPTRLKRSSRIQRREREGSVGGSPQHKQSPGRTESPKGKQSTQQAEDLGIFQRHESARDDYNVDSENLIKLRSSQQQQKQLVPKPLNVPGSKALAGLRARSVTEPLGMMPRQEEDIPPVPRVPQRYMFVAPVPLSLGPVTHERAENEQPAAQGRQIEELNKGHVQDEQQQSEKARLKQVQVNRVQVERPNFGRPQPHQPKLDQAKPDEPKLGQANLDQSELDHQQPEPKHERFRRDFSAPVNSKAKTAGKSILRYGGGKSYHELLKEIMPPAEAPPKLTKPPLPSPLPDFLLNPPEFLKHPPELSQQIPHTSYLDDEPDLGERHSPKLIKSETSSKLTNKPSSSVKTLFKARSFQRLRRRSNSQCKDQQVALKEALSSQPPAAQSATPDQDEEANDDEVALTSRWSSDSSDERPPPTESRLKKLKRVFSIPKLRQRKSSFFSREKPDLEARGSMGSGGSGKDSPEVKRSSASGSSGSKKSGN
ncbi:hypothetical protein B0J18DRAFT_493432 [Chaetomium sp. MPI-SDFR-AT-0129]|nr:hypothetical protein B0J18DRAFT_493432 [Chaetomium sp. MPI-SDFR-AT-0129]